MHPRTGKDDCYFGCCCSTFGLAASRFAINASYSGVPRRGGASAGRPPHPMRHVRDPLAGSPTARAGRQGKACKAQESRFDRGRSLRLQLSSHDQPPVSPYRRDCRSTGRALDARGPALPFPRKSPSSILVAVPPEDRLALCKTKIRPSSLRQSNHRSPFSLW